MTGISKKNVGGMLEEGGCILGIIFSPLSTTIPFLTFLTQSAAWTCTFVDSFWRIQSFLFSKVGSYANMSSSMYQLIRNE